jgi:hypothetical protein
MASHVLARLPHGAINVAARLREPSTSAILPVTMFIRRYMSSSIFRTWNTVNIRPTHRSPRHNLFNHNFQRIVSLSTSTKRAFKMDVQLYVYDLSQVSKRNTATGIGLDTDASRVLHEACRANSSEPK